MILRIEIIVKFIVVVVMIILIMIPLPYIIQHVIFNKKIDMPH